MRCLPNSLSRRRQWRSNRGGGGLGGPPNTLTNFKRLAIKIASALWGLLLAAGGWGLFPYIPALFHLLLQISEHAIHTFNYCRKKKLQHQIYRFFFYLLRLSFTLQFSSFCWWGRKISLGTRYSSYATEQRFELGDLPICLSKCLKGGSEV